MSTEASTSVEASTRTLSQVRLAQRSVAKALELLATDPTSARLSIVADCKSTALVLTKLKELFDASPNLARQKVLVPDPRDFTLGDSLWVAAIRFERGTIDAAALRDELGPVARLIAKWDAHIAAPPKDENSWLRTLKPPKTWGSGGYSLVILSE